MLLDSDESEVAVTAKVDHGLPPEPVDDVRSSTRLSQFPRNEGADMTTVGVTAENGGLIIIVAPATRTQDEQSSPGLHAACKSVPLRSITTSPGITLLAPATEAEMVFTSSH